MKRRQQGAFNVVAAATLVGVVLIVALALDTGRFYLEQRRLQGAADAAALAAVRELTAHYDSADLEAAVEQSALLAARENGYGGDFAAGNAILFGHMTQSATRWEFTEGYSDEGLYNAVRIVARSSVPRSLVAPVLLPGTAPLSATAVARQEAIAQIKVGSFLVKAELLKPILGRLLGADVTAFSYDRLLGAAIRLGDLQAAVGADTMDELLAANISLRDFLRFGADALRRGGDDLAAVQLNNYANAVASPLPVKVGDLIEVSSDDPAVLDARLDAFELLMASAQLANRDRQISGISLDVAALGLSGIADLKLDLKVREAPCLAIGPPGRNPFTGKWRTQAHNGQVELTLHLNLLSLGLLDLDVDAAGADAWLKGISGARPADSGIPRSSADVGASTRPAGLRLSLLGIASAEADTGAVARDPIVYVGPFPKTETVGTEWGPALGELVKSMRIKVLGIPVPVPGASLIAGLLDPVGDAVLTPLLQLLGIQLGGADVTVVYLDAGDPRLML